MLYVPSGADFRWSLDSQAGVRPAAAYGAAMTAGAVHTKGSYVTLIGTPTAYDSYGILINANSLAGTTSSRQALMDIGVDQAGGTSFTDTIPNLYITNASPYNVGSGGVWYYFPLFIPAGSTIGARFQCAVASATARVRVILYGRPVNPSSVRFGTHVEAIGDDTATSAGVTVTPGTTAEGAWASIGSPARSVWWWQLGFGQNDTTTGAAAIHVDLSAGDATFKKSLVDDLLIINTTIEQQNNSPLIAGCTANADASVSIYARAQSSAAADSNCSVIVHALGD